MLRRNGIRGCIPAGRGLWFCRALRKRGHTRIRYLKRGATDEAKFEADRQVRQTVESILDDIMRRGDAAVRELSARFDKWEPEEFRLSPEQIQAMIDSL